MCRYAMYGPYKLHYVCFACRKIFRQWPDPVHETDGERVCVCPQCKQPMQDMGLDFKAPPQNDLEQWEKSRLLYVNGYHWHGCGCGGNYPNVATLADVPLFLAAQAQRKAEWERQTRSKAKWAAQKQRTRKARREREREAAQGIALSAQRDE